MGSLVSDEQATGKVKEVFDEIRSTMGLVPNFFRALAAVDAEWMELNWMRWKGIMGRSGSLDRKTKELLAVAAAMLSNSPYVRVVHETLALKVGASEQDLVETKQVVDLFASFSIIAESLDVPFEAPPESAAR